MIISLILITALSIGGSGVYKTIKENGTSAQNKNEITTQDTTDDTTEQSPITDSNTSANITQNFKETRDFGTDGYEDEENEYEDENEYSNRNKNSSIKNTPISSTPSKTQTVNTSTTVNSNTNTSTKTYTLADIAKHPNASSCYTAVRGIVYDLTNFIVQHPGGANNILKICGKDGTSAFVNQHAGRPSPEQELAGHKIGTLAN